MKMIYTAILIPFEEKEGYTIVVPDLNGCVSEGDTLEEAIVICNPEQSGFLFVHFSLDKYEFNQYNTM